MKYQRTVTILVCLTAFASAVTTSFGIFSNDGPGPFQYRSIRNQTVEIYGKGIYQHMSADVAIQGIAQDYVTLFIGIPILLISLSGYRKGSVRALFILSGTFGYFLVTYLFYTAMGMYNIMFLGYAALLGLSFFGLFLSLSECGISNISKLFSPKAPNRFAGGFLIVNSLLIAFLWLSMVIPPLIDGTIFPVELAHYTTLIVQGFDLGLLLPISLITGILLMKNSATGYFFGIPYLVFLSILMTALIAKMMAMAVNGVKIIPAVFIIPLIYIATICCAWLMIRHIKPQAN